MLVDLKTRMSRGAARLKTKVVLRHCFRKIGRVGKEVQKGTGKRVALERAFRFGFMRDLKHALCKWREIAGKRVKQRRVVLEEEWTSEQGSFQENLSKRKE